MFSAHTASTAREKISDVLINISTTPPMAPTTYSRQCCSTERTHQNRCAYKRCSELRSPVIRGRCICLDRCSSSLARAHTRWTMNRCESGSSNVCQENATKKAGHCFHNGPVFLYRTRRKAMEMSTEYEQVAAVTIFPCALHRDVLCSGRQLQPDNLHHQAVPPPLLPSLTTSAVGFKRCSRQLGDEAILRAIRNSVGKH